MVKIQRVVAKRRGLVSISTSSVRDVLPAEFAMALIDYEKLGAAHNGRVLAYDRGHCAHHELPANSECHCHREPCRVTAPADCSFVPLLGEFCSESLAYWTAEGLGDLGRAGVFDAALILDDLAEALDE